MKAFKFKLKAYLFSEKYEEHSNESKEIQDID
jgi:hypothetical protein